MKPNRSIPSATVIPVLIYPDVREAVAWLTEAFGFRERLQIGESHRSQMSVGDGGAVIAADVRHGRVPPRAGESTHSVLVRVEDANAHCARAREQMASIDSGQRISRTNAQGERYFLEDDQRAQEAAKTQQLVSQWCK